MTKREKTALIIGAGPAGLTAAYELLTKTDDVKPVILEELDCVGGISRTVFFEGNGIDIGGHRMFSKSPLILDLWETFLPKDKNPDEEDAVMMTRQRFSEILYSRKLFNYPISMSFKTFKNMGLKRTVKAGFSYLKSCFKKREEITLEDFMINRFGQVLYEMFFEKYTEKVWGRHPRDISKEWGEQRIKGLSLIKAVLNAFHLSKKKETTLIDEFLYPKYGCGQLWNLMLDEITRLGGEIHYRSKVLGFENDENSIKSVKIEYNGEIQSYQADYLFSSMPVKDLVAGLQNQPEQVNDVAKALPYRDYMLVGLYVDDINLKENGKITKDCWIYIQEDDVKVGRMQIMNNWSPYLVKDKNKVFISLEYFCNEGDSYWNMSDEEFINFSIDEVVKLGIVDKNKVISSTRLKVKKAYPAYFDSYEQFDIVREQLDKFDNLYCIGRNGQHRYNNMDHSMLTAIEAVKILKGQSNRENLWNINAEKEYHESK